MESNIAATATVATAHRAGMCSAAGRGRDHNEDAALCGPTWFAIADGMGGHTGGQIASRMVIELLASQAAPTSLADVAACVERIDHEVCSTARNLGVSGMGATLVAAAEMPHGVVIAHVGDSRCYRWVDGSLTVLTRDHSYVQELVELGKLTADETHHHRLGHLLTQALGVADSATPDTLFLPGPAGRLLLCSDGLTTVLPPRTIGRVLAGVAHPQSAAERLVALATQAGADDNVTAVVVDDLGGRL